MKPAELIAKLSGTRKYPIERVTVTQAECDAVATMARQMVVEPDTTRMNIENPAFPWEPNIELPSIIIEAGNEVSRDE